MNPFVFGRVVDGVDFCPRPQLVTILKSYLEQGQNSVLIGERRVGKTSLIFEALRKSKKRRVVYADLLEIKTLDDFVNRLAMAILRLESQDAWLSKAMKSLSFLRPTLSIDPATGMPSLFVDAARSKRPESLEGVLDVIHRLGSSDRLVVVLDEFQDIQNLDDHRSVVAVFRSKYQFHGKTPYVFAGSVRKDIESMFTDSNSPLFKSAASLFVGPLDRTDFAEFIHGKVKGGRRTMAPDVLDEIFSIACETPGDVQQLLFALWSVTEGKRRIDRSAIPAAIEVIFASELKGYELSLGSVTGQQLHVLVTLARSGSTEPTGSEFMRAAGVTQASSITRALKALEKKRLIFRSGKQYRFVNPFFAAWLVTKEF